jgi:hypothetical protein
MALSNDEIVNQDTLTILTKLTRTPFPVGYARIRDCHINYDDPSFVATLCLYFNEASRQENIDSCSTYQIGCSLNQTVLNAFQQADDRNALYKAVEFIVHFQFYEAELRKIADKQSQLAYIAEKNTILDKLNDDLDVDLSVLFSLDKITF